MKHYEVKLYQKQYFSVWNDFVKKSKNASFLFHRDFMEYHKERFEDYSLMVFESKKIVALLPANRVESVVYSHQGLSYGSLVVLDDLRIKDYITIFHEVLLFLNNHSVEQLEFKLIPKIYHSTFADEVDYVAFLAKAETFRVDSYLVIDNQQLYNPNRNRKRALKLASELNIETRNDQNYSAFWNQILIPNLNMRFGVKPVHTLDEIQKLANLFPNQIKLFTAYLQNEIKAGVVLFLTDDVAHFQYSSGGNDRNDTAALDFLFDFIIQKYAEKKFISFGTSSENNGLNLNEGLVYWKESFGANTTVQTFLRFNTSNYKLIDSI